VNRFAIPIIAFAIALLGPVSAQRFYRYSPPATTSTPVIAALIAGDGRVIHGKGFSIKHLGTGEYYLEFDQGIFPSGCVAVAVEGWEKPVVSHVFEYPTECRLPEWHITLRSPSTGDFEDASFQFIAAEEDRR
jgi:hypothetical protein